MKKVNDPKAWAYNEAKRRAAALDGACSIYKKDEHYIVRMTSAAEPRGWQRLATIEADGSFSFGGAS